MMVVQLIVAQNDTMLQDALEPALMLSGTMLSQTLSGDTVMEKRPKLNFILLFYELVVVKKMKNEEALTSFQPPLMTPLLIEIAQRMILPTSTSLPTSLDDTTFDRNRPTHDPSTLDVDYLHVD